MGDFNSSDVEFEPAQKKKKMSGRQPGRDSIAHRARKLNNKLWVERVNPFRTHSLKKFLRIAFRGDDVLRFSDSIFGSYIPTPEGNLLLTTTS
ncbi:hypothetical protein V1520DRAFT_356728 [Lipomyces starkeyi]